MKKEITSIINTLHEDLLSPTEETVFELTARGYSNKEIAELLKTNVHSVTNSKQRAFIKLGYTSQREVMKKVLELLVGEK